MSERVDGAVEQIRRRLVRRSKHRRKSPLRISDELAARLRDDFAARGTVHGDSPVIPDTYPLMLFGVLLVDADGEFHPWRLPA